MSNTLDQRRSKSVGETRNGTVSFSGFMDSSEVITGLPSVVQVTIVPSSIQNLTLTNVAINTSALVVLGETVAIGKAVQFRIGGGSAGQLYEIRVTASTDAGQTFLREILLDVTAD